MSMGSQNIITIDYWGRKKIFNFSPEKIMLAGPWILSIFPMIHRRYIKDNTLCYDDSWTINYDIVMKLCGKATANVYKKWNSYLRINHLYNFLFSWRKIVRHIQYFHEFKILAQNVFLSCCNQWPPVTNSMEFPLNPRRKMIA